MKFIGRYPSDYYEELYPGYKWAGSRIRAQRHDWELSLEDFHKADIDCFIGDAPAAYIKDHVIEASVPENRNRGPFMVLEDHVKKYNDMMEENLKKIRRQK